jgi:type III secretory pathway component EscT
MAIGKSHLRVAFFLFRLVAVAFLSHGRIPLLLHVVESSYIYRVIDKACLYLSQWISDLPYFLIASLSYQSHRICLRSRLNLIQYDRYTQRI